MPEETDNTEFIIPHLPDEIAGFHGVIEHDDTSSMSADAWREALNGAEVDDKRQQIMLRPWFALGVFLLILVQNFGIFMLVTWALNRDQLPELQLILSVLIGGTLAQSYFILRLITKKVFDNIDYHNGEK